MANTQAMLATSGDSSQALVAAYVLRQFEMRIRPLRAEGGLCTPGAQHWACNREGEEGVKERSIE